MALPQDPSTDSPLPRRAGALPLRQQREEATARDDQQLAAPAGRPRRVWVPARTLANPIARSVLEYLVPARTLANPMARSVLEYPFVLQFGLQRARLPSLTLVPASVVLPPATRSKKNPTSECPLPGRAPPVPASSVRQAQARRAVRHACSPRAPPLRCRAAGLSGLCCRWRATSGRCTSRRIWATVSRAARPRSRPVQSPKPAARSVTASTLNAIGEP